MKKAVHRTRFKDGSFSVCGLDVSPNGGTHTGRGPYRTTDPAKVTCGNCKRVMGKS